MSKPATKRFQGVEMPEKLFSSDRRTLVEWLADALIVADGLSAIKTHDDHFFARFDGKAATSVWSAYWARATERLELVAPEARGVMEAAAMMLRYRGFTTDVSTPDSAYQTQGLRDRFDALDASLRAALELPALPPAAARIPCTMDEADTELPL